MNKRVESIFAKPLLFILYLSISLVFVIVLWWAGGTLRYDLKVRTFSNRVCKNLVDSGFINEKDCIRTRDIYETVEHYFPIGISREYVEAGFQDTDTVSVTRWFSWEDCPEPYFVEYSLGSPWVLGFRTLVQFKFCDGVLMQSRVSD